MKSLAACLIVSALVAGCQDGSDAAIEESLYGPDRYDPYLRETWEKCTAYASDSVCLTEIYGPH